MQSVMPIIYTQEFSLVLQYDNTGLHNCFMYKGTCPECHCPLLKYTKGFKKQNSKDFLLNRILHQDMIIYVSIYTMLKPKEQKLIESVEKKEERLDK